MAISDLAHRLGHQGLRQAAEKGLRAMHTLSNWKEKTKEQMGVVVQTLEVNASAFAFGFARGYFSEPGKDLAVLGVPLDLGIGILGHGVGVFGGLGRYKEDMHNLSDGALASFSTTLGLKLGVEQREKHPPTSSSPAATSGFSPLSNSELARRIANARL